MVTSNGSSDAGSESVSSAADPCLSGFFDGVSADFLTAFPQLQAARKAVISIPKVQKWYAAEEGKSYMELSVGGHPAGECYASMIASSKAAA